MTTDYELTQRRLAETPVDISGLDVNAYAERAQPTIRRACQRCGLVLTEAGFYRHGAWVDGSVIVNERTGTAHAATEYGMTACGLDATGPSWWWPL